MAPIAVPLWFMVGAIENNYDVSLDLTRRLLTGRLGER